MTTNVLIIVIDSLRSDKLFGKEKTAKTPILDNLIQNGYFFPNNMKKTEVGRPQIHSRTQNIVAINQEKQNYFLFLLCV